MKNNSAIFKKKLKRTTATE